MKPLQDRTALVTGASSGIGAATARALAGAGARVTLAARRRERLETVARDCPGSRVVELDVRDADAVLAALEGTAFDIVLANAGLALGASRLPEGDPTDWSTVIDTNVKGVLHVLRAALPAMAARGTGDVVLLGSVAGRQVYPGGNVYCMTKFAVRGLYEALRVDMQDSGLRFTTVDPGLVETEFSLVRHRGDRARAAAVYAGFEPLRPEDVADAILYAVTRPPNVNIGEIVMWAGAQSGTTYVRRRT
jgi:3-hydroxy acid dehydrogenase / malonic semialdehyde reductase